jgi:hypothetical protein
MQSLNIKEDCIHNYHCALRCYVQIQPRIQEGILQTHSLAKTAKQMIWAVISLTRAERRLSFFVISVRQADRQNANTTA